MQNWTRKKSEDQFITETRSHGEKQFLTWVTLCLRASVVKDVYSSE